LLQGSRLITDWESRYPAEEALAPLAKRKQSRVAERLSTLSRDYQLASREMSLVAVVSRSGDRPGEIPETRVVPVGMPQDVKLDAYSPSSLNAMFTSAPGLGFGDMLTCVPAPPQAPPPATNSPSERGLFGSLFGMFEKSRGESTDDLLMNLASQLEPDGGMPGQGVVERAARSVAALLAFVAAGHTLTTGAFRSHVARLVEYLKPVREVPDRSIIDLAIQAAGTGKVPSGEWLELARIPRIPWTRIEKSLRL
jgi:hypothetical protein